MSEDHDLWVACLDELRRHSFYHTYKARVAELSGQLAGKTWLEVGCGTGDDVPEDGVGSFAVCLDLSFEMAREANLRSRAGCIAADAHQMPFSDATFDLCRSDRVLQHVRDPATVLAEIARVTAPGGRVIVVDPDYDTQVLDIGHPRFARALMRYRAKQMLRNGNVAHRTPGLLVKCGLSIETVEAHTMVIRDTSAAVGVLQLRTWASHAHSRGMLAASDVDTWAKLIDMAEITDSFLYALTFFITVGLR